MRKNKDMKDMKDQEMMQKITTLWVEEKMLRDVITRDMINQFGKRPFDILFPKDKIYVFFGSRDNITEIRTLEWTDPFLAPYTKNIVGLISKDV